MWILLALACGGRPAEEAARSDDSGALFDLAGEG